MSQTSEDALRGAGRCFGQVDALGEALESTLSVSTNPSVDDRLAALHEIWLEWQQEWKQCLEALQSVAEDITVSDDDKYEYVDDIVEDGAQAIVPARDSDNAYINGDINAVAVEPEFATPSVDTDTETDDSFEIVPLDSDVDGELSMLENEDSYELL